MRVLEYADHVGVSERTLREWIYSRVIPTLRIGRLIFIDPAKADAALERRERKEISVKQSSERGRS